MAVEEVKGAGGEVTIKMDLDKCEGCGECIGVCPAEVWEIGDDGKAHPVRAEDCQVCCSCVEACPNGAIWIDACE
ncbi:4Fe-4S dicluster domain-containing protein [Archaeoglobus sp.]